LHDTLSNLWISSISITVRFAVNHGRIPLGRIRIAAADWDQRRGRRVAETVYGLTVCGTVGTLVVAKRRQLIQGRFLCANCVPASPNGPF
jgi:hypothetical protein